MSYGDSINVTNRVYNKTHHSRIVGHSFNVKYNDEAKYLNNVINYAICKVQVTAVFAKKEIGNFYIKPFSI